MQAAIRVVSKNGLAYARTADIAREAGVSEGLIFKYFPTKGRLFAVIIGDIFARLQSGLNGLNQDNRASAREKLAALIDFHFDFFSSEIGQLIFTESDTKSLVDIGSIFEQGVKPYIRFVTEILHEGVVSGEFRPLDEEIAAAAMIGTMQLVLVSRLFIQNGLDLERAKKEVYNYILSGVKAVPVNGINLQEKV